MYMGQNGKGEFYTQKEIGQPDDQSEVLNVWKGRIRLASRDHNSKTIIVLYELPNAPSPYVTWCARKDKPEATFWGHYFQNFVDAVHDYDKR